MKKTIMEKTFKKLTYSFIAVPTNLFYCLDTNLRNCLIVLLHLSSIFADADGYFSISNQDLQEYFRLGKNLTSVCIETLYRNGLISTRIELTKSKKNLIKYRVNTEKFEEYNKLNFKSIVDNDSYYINTLDYGKKDSDFKVTYTAATENNSSNEESIPEPTDIQDNVSEEIPTNDAENVSEGQETSNPDNVEEYTLSEVDEDEVLNTFFYDEVDDCPLTDDELREYEEWQKAPIEKRMKEWKEPEDELSFLDDKVDEETELKQAESPIESIRVDNKVIETASVIPSDIYKVEKRETPKLDIDEKTIQACNDLVKRYKNFQCKNSNESAEMCVAASSYIAKQYQNGKIYLEDKDRLIRELVNERFRKFPI